MQANKSFASRLYDLLNRPNTAKGQFKPDKDNPEGKFRYGYVRQIGLGSFEKHLAGKSTKAVSVANGGFANFICWDIDEHFPDLLPIVAGILRDRKWDRAAFATSGSDPGRGKVILCGKPRIPQAVAYRIAKEVLDQVREETKSSFLLNTIGDEKLDAFPKAGSGGEVRILGRNQGRDGSLEEALALDGKPSDLKHVRPVTIHYRPADIVTSQRAQWATRLVETPITGIASDAYKVQVRLADEALRLGGESRAVELLHGWCLGMTAIRDSTIRQLKRRDASERAVDYVKQYRREAAHAKKPTDWEPLDLSEERIPKGASRIYEALAKYASEFRLDPHCFGMDYARLAALAGYRDKSRAWKSVSRAEDIGLLFRLHRGSGHGENLRGLVMLCCLRGADEAMQAAYDQGTQSQMYLERVAECGQPAIRMDGGKRVGFTPDLPLAA
jgi:hypothetical protein